MIRLIANTGARAHEYPALTALREPLEQLVARLQSVTMGLLIDLAKARSTAAWRTRRCT
jgi:butyryl-CoA dehydrogenase